MDELSASFANISNINLIESLYQDYLANPETLDASWRHFFAGMQFGANLSHVVPTQQSPDLRVYQLIDAYRQYGHLMADFNPISTSVPVEPEELDLEKYGFKKEELNNEFPTCAFLEKPVAPLRMLIEALKKTYSGSIGVEYMGLGEPLLEIWLQKHIEPSFPLHLSIEDRIWILQLLNRSELFESFLHTKYVGQKRFSLEGGETLIPMLAAILE